jgi:hypothetical protein
MSSRERWIVYPLIFLALGIAMRVALREKYFPPARVQSEEITAGRIRCAQLQVDQLLTANSIVSRSAQCEAVAILGSNGRPTIILGNDSKGRGGLLQVLSSTGIPLIILQPTDTGGAVVTCERKKDGAASSPDKSKTPLPKSPEPPPKPPEKAPAKTAP